MLLGEVDSDVLVGSRTPRGGSFLPHSGANLLEKQAWRRAARYDVSAFVLFYVQSANQIVDFRLLIAD
jgi:hypothetical protein